MENESTDRGVDAAATSTLVDEINELMDSPLEGEVGPSTNDDLTGEAPSGDGVTDGEIAVEGDVGKVSEIGSADTKLPDQVLQDAQVPNELDTLKAQIESLKGLVTQLASPKEGARKSPELSLNLDDLISGVDFDDIMESKEKFMEFIKQAFQISTQSTTGYVQNFVPDVVTRHVSMQEVRENFYSANTDLNAVRPYVAMVASNVAQANPEWGVAEVLVKAAEVARESLGISKTQPSVDKSKGKPPVLPGARGVRQATSQKSDLQQEIDELLEG